MQTSIFLARLIGPVMFLVGRAVLINQREFRTLAQDFISNRSLLFLSCLVTLPVGLAILLVHNIWAADGRLMITMFGWAVAITSAFACLRRNSSPRAAARCSSASACRSLQARSGPSPDFYFVFLDFAEHHPNGRPS